MINTDAMMHCFVEIILQGWVKLKLWPEFSPWILSIIVQLPQTLQRKTKRQLWTAPCLGPQRSLQLITWRLVHCVLHRVLQHACKTHIVIQTRSSDKQHWLSVWPWRNCTSSQWTKPSNIAHGFLGIEIEIFFLYLVSNGVWMKALYAKHC